VSVLPPPERDQAEAVVRFLIDKLGADLVGVYLHGSAVLGGLRPTSDLDLLAVTARPLRDADRAALAGGLLALSGRPRRPIELVVVARDDVRPWRFPPVLQLVYGEWLRADIEQGRVEGGHPNPDLAIAVSAVVQRGETLAGPPPAALLDPVPPEDVAAASVAGVRSMLADLEGDSRNVLLTLCRVWVTLATGDVVPKDAAAAWALERLSAEDRRAVERARRMYLEGWDESRWPDPPAVRSVAEALTRAIEQERLS
jgi:predicted nucleotidyltransferase